MTTIATHQPAAEGPPVPAAAIASIPLSKLVVWDGNVRKTGAADGLDELSASIAAHGVLQSLVVRKGQRGKYAVVAGRRRYLALSALADAGTIASDTAVPCRVLHRTDDATEISLTENVVRAPMHPADQFEAFRDLIDAGSSVADVAARFGISETAVKQRLKLARVTPQVFDAYRAGELTLEQVQAFALSDDHGAQERVFGELPRRGGGPDDIRAALTQGEIPATDRRARFVTLPDYELAGGTFRRDLFAQGDDGVFLLDAELLDRLVLEKLQAHADVLKAEGWKWTESAATLDYEARAGFRTRRPEPQPLSEEAEAEHASLAAEYETGRCSCGGGACAGRERLPPLRRRQQPPAFREGHALPGGVQGRVRDRCRTRELVRPASRRQRCPLALVPRPRPGHAARPARLLRGAYRERSADQAGLPRQRPSPRCGHIGHSIERRHDGVVHAIRRELLRTCGTHDDHLRDGRGQGRSREALLGQAQEARAGGACRA